MYSKCPNMAQGFPMKHRSVKERCPRSDYTISMQEMGMESVIAPEKRAWAKD